MFYLVKCLLNKVLLYLSYLQGYGKTLLHQRCSQSQKRNMFYIVVALENFVKFIKNISVGVTFNKVAGIKRFHHKCFSMKCFF